jgi:hypothetical protein
MNITGWYESENGAVLVDETGTSAAIFEALRERDPDFGLTDMEIEDENGNDYSMAAMIWAETLAKGGE